MSATWEFASYHLGYEVINEVPTVSLHTHADHIERLQSQTEVHRTAQRTWWLPAFETNEERFGFGGSARIAASSLVDGWVALQLQPSPAPKRTKPSDYYSSFNSVLQPLATANYLLRYIQEHGVDDSLADPDHFQQIVLSGMRLSAEPQHNGMSLRAKFTPDLLDRINRTVPIRTIEDPAKAAMNDLMSYTEGLSGYEDFIDVQLMRPLEPYFKYPGGGGSAFHSIQPDKSLTTDLELYASNTDYPYMQLMVLGGLATLNQLTFSE